MPIDEKSARMRVLLVENVEAGTSELEDLTSTLIKLAKSTRALLGIKLAEIGFHIGQDDFLLSLEAGELVAMSSLAERLSVRASTVSKTMDRLVEKRLVERVEDSADSRRTMIKITPLGIVAQAAIQEIHDQIGKDLEKDMSSVQIAATRMALCDIQERLTTKLMRLR